MCAFVGCDASEHLVCMQQFGALLYHSRPCWATECLVAAWSHIIDVPLVQRHPAQCLLAYWGCKCKQLSPVQISLLCSGVHMYVTHLMSPCDVCKRIASGSSSWFCDSCFLIYKATKRIAVYCQQQLQLPKATVFAPEELYVNP